MPAVRPALNAQPYSGPAARREHGKILTLQSDGVVLFGFQNNTAASAKREEPLASQREEPRAAEVQNGK